MDKFSKKLREFYEFEEELRPFLQLPFYLSEKLEKKEEADNKGSKVIIIDLLEGECQIKL